MRRICIGIAVAGLAVNAVGGSLSNRWVYVTDGLLKESSVARVSNIVWMAKSNGMNGMMAGFGFDYLKYWPKERRDRLARIKEICEEAGIEIIPTMWSLGYGQMQNYDRNVVEGMPVEGVPFRVDGTNAVYDAASAPVQPISAKTGLQREKQYYRLIKKVSVKPHRRYRYAFEVRTQELVGDRPFMVIAVDATRKKYNERAARKVDIRPTQDWTRCELDFCSAESDAFYLYIGFMGGWKSGSFELRQVTLTEIAPARVLRRPGAPFALRNASTGETYEEGRDYVIPDLLTQKRRKEAYITLALPPGSRVKAGDRLLFDSHTPALAQGSQVSTCLSEPSLYDYIEDSAIRTEAALHPKKCHISMDEFRNGGTCAACRARGLTMGEIYADAVTKVFNIVQKVHPGAEVYIWSDMLDPNHNGVSVYYNCATSFEDAWKGVPKELIVCCWYGGKRDISMPFFASHGFRTMAAAYYDEKPPLKGSRKWRDVVLRTDGAVGIMYTTWRGAYADLPAFCEILKNPSEK